MHRKLASTRVCLVYDDLVKTIWPSLSFSKAISIFEGTLLVGAQSHLQAHQIKLYEYEIILAINQVITAEQLQVKRVYIQIQ